MDAAPLTDELRRALITGDLPVGHVITESEVSARFGVSKTPVAEALRALAWSGWVTVLPRRGYRVVEVSISQTWEALTLWEELLNVRRDQGLWRAVTVKDLSSMQDLWPLLRGQHHALASPWLDMAQREVCDRLERVVRLLSSDGDSVPDEVARAVTDVFAAEMPTSAAIAELGLRLRRWIQDLLMQSDTPFTR